MKIRRSNSNKVLFSIMCSCLMLVNICFVYSATQYSGEFLNLGVGVRALGMGGAFTGVADDATAGYWNPGGLAQVNGQEVSMMYGQVLNNQVSYNSIGYVYPLADVGNFGLNIILSGLQDIPDTRALTSNNGEVVYDTAKVTYANSTSNAYYVTYSRKVKDNLFAGANLKMLQESIFEFSASGYGLDLGAMYSLQQDGKGVKFGLNVQDALGTSLKWSTGHEDAIPLSVRTGVGYTTVVSPTMDLTLAGDVDTKYGTNINLGGELLISQQVSLRAGYKQIGGAESAQSNLTFGAGFEYLKKYSINYAYTGLMDNGLGDSQRLSLSLKF